MADETAASARNQQRGRPFQKGQSGNPAGRKPGSRQKLSDNLLATIAADFAKHGQKTLDRVRETDPTGYMKIVVSLVPKELAIGDGEGGPLTVVIRKIASDG